LQCVSVLQCVAVCVYRVCCLDPIPNTYILQCVAVCCSVLQCVYIECAVLILSPIHIYFSVLQCVAVCCSMLQRVAACCSVLQCVVRLHSRRRMDCPTQSIIYVPSLVCVFHKTILLIVQCKYLQSCSKDFKLQNLILLTRLCGTGFIPQHD